MYPTKNMLDYMTEMNRLFPRSSDHDMLQSPPTSNITLQSLNLSSVAQYSSSTDTSPESFPDMTSHRYAETYQHYDMHRPGHNIRHVDGLDPQQFVKQGEFYPNPEVERQYRDLRLDHRFKHKSEVIDAQFMPQLQETPFVVRRQRPIIGRKIMDPISQTQKMDEVLNGTWPEETSMHVSPNLEKTLSRNTFYELFPNENNRNELKSPAKTSPSSFTTSSQASLSPQMAASPVMTNLSPRMTSMTSSMTNISPSMNMSPRMTNMYQQMSETSSMMSEMSPSRKMSPGSPSSYCQRFQTHFKEPIVGPSTSFGIGSGTSKMCTFCRKNGETPMVYMTHAVKEKVENMNIVTCPILRSHVCSTCGATGDNAHTITYCPILRSTNNGQPLKSTTVTLKNTRIKSNGRRRY